MRKIIAREIGMLDFACVGERIEADEHFYNSLTLESVLAIHNVPGGTAAERVHEALQTAKEKLNLYLGVAHACT